MIQVFMSKKRFRQKQAYDSPCQWSVKQTSGHLVFIDDDNRPMHELARDIRFINTESYEITDFNTLYGLICGILAQDYDVEKIYVDGLMSGIDLKQEGAEEQFNKLASLSDDNKITIFLYFE